MAVLYQKYRPQNFSEIFGQNHIKITLQNEILNNKVSHAYLFCGPRAVGKTTLARVLAKAVNCEKRSTDDYEPCNQCTSCQSINNFSNLDIIEIDAASNTGVDNVRDNIINLSRVKSSANKYKVFIIDEVHMLSTSAFNALLKTLEEPPLKVIFILCTTEVYKVPLTIISRCERFDFKKISLPDMIAKLERISKSENLEVEPEVLELIALKTEGHLRDAESLLNQIMAISGKKIDLASANLVIPYNNLEENIKLLEFLSKKDLGGAIRAINDLLGNGINLKNFLGDLLDLLRKMILNKIDSSLSSSLGLDLSEKLEMRINKLNSSFKLEDLIKISESFIKALKELPSALIPSWPLELAIISIAHQKEDFKKNLEERREVISPKSPDSNLSNLETLGKISKEDLEANWNEFLTKLKPHNHSLSFVMQSCRINKVDGQKICLSFRYKFHKERLEQQEIKKLIEKTLKDVYKKDLIIESTVDENLEFNNQNNKEEGQIIDDLLKTFGGQVIN